MEIQASRADGIQPGPVLWEGHIATAANDICPVGEKNPQLRVLVGNECTVGKLREPNSSEGTDGGDPFVFVGKLDDAGMSRSS